MGTNDGSIIATIITIHMARNEVALPNHVPVGIGIQAIDRVQPPGIVIPPMADMDAQHSTVTAALTVNSKAVTRKNPGREARLQCFEGEIF